MQLGAASFRRVTWREGTNGELSSRFCFRRVKVAQNDGIDVEQREPVWLTMEWPDGEEKPTKCTLTTLPRRMSKKEIVRIVKERWRTERVHEELKGELGLDHYGGLVEGAFRGGEIAIVARLGRGVFGRRPPRRLRTCSAI